MKERLQKIIAMAGISSRRAAEKLILEGRVSVNGKTVRQLGVRADPQRDEIRVNGKLISFENNKVYVVMHKPRGYVTTMRDPQNRPVVTDLLNDIPERVYPVGRLDYDSEGLLILTNDGQFAHRIQHPRFGLPKTYHVKIEGHLARREIQSLLKGIQLPDGMFCPRDLRVFKVNVKSSWLSLTITEGRNRVIKRAFESIGHSVRRLIRISIGTIHLGNLKAGMYRHLTKKEIQSIIESSKLLKS